MLFINITLQSKKKVNFFKRFIERFIGKTYQRSSAMLITKQGQNIRAFNNSFPELTNLILFPEFVYITTHHYSFTI